MKTKISQPWAIKDLEKVKKLYEWGLYTLRRKTFEILLRQNLNAELFFRNIVSWHTITNPVQVFLEP